MKIGRNILLNVLPALLFLGFVSCESSTGPSQIQESIIHYRAAWSPDGSAIAFIAYINGTQGIYAVDTSSSNIRLIYAGDTGGPTWSPDSKWLAFSMGLNLYKVKANGDSLTQISSGGRDVRPSWSRDGKTIAFVRAGISLLDVKTDSTWTLIGIGDFPSWHPNETEIVMETSNGSTFSFYAVRTDSGYVRQLFVINAVGDISFSSISPGGQEILFTLATLNDLTQIWKIDLTTGTLSKLTDDGGDFAAWSPDGSKIAYTRTAFGDGALWIMNKDGTGKRRLTNP
jgi:Tol biopolymer transport system component